MYTIEERSRLFDQRVVYPALRVVVLLPLGLSAQLSAEEQVSYPGVRQVRFDVTGVEVRRVPGVRARPGIHENLDPMFLQQAGELLGRMVGMPDREDRHPFGIFSVHRAFFRRPLLTVGS